MDAPSVTGIATQINATIRAHRQDNGGAPLGEILGGLGANVPELICTSMPSHEQQQTLDAFIQQLKTRFSTAQDCFTTQH